MVAHRAPAVLTALGREDLSLDQALRGAIAEPNPGLRELADHISQVGAGPGSPTREILVRLGDRWSSLLVSVLATGRYRHKELHRVVNVLSRLSPDTRISQRMLTLRLRALERDGLVNRLVGEGKAPPVDYGLTPLGASLAQRLRALIEWSAEHGEMIIAAQRAFDAPPTPSSHASNTVRHRAR